MIEYSNRVRYMNLKYIKKQIKKYDTIIIHRHTNPDMDALGSQLGLKEIILNNFPNKEVYCVGDKNKFISSNLMDNIDDSIYKNSLVFIVDVSVRSLISDDRYKLAKEIIIIDHHKNNTDINNAKWYCNTTYEAAAAFIADIALKLKLKITPKAADYLMAGIITDSGRFQFLKNRGTNLFKIAAILTEKGADPVNIYNELYVQSLEEKQLYIDFQKLITFKDGVGYMFIKEDVLNKYPNYTPQEISRMTVNLMAGVKGYPIWANFTEDKKNKKVLSEFRSRKIKIVDIAKAHGGGGHDNACGATIKDFNEAKQIIKEFKNLIKEEI